MAPPMAWSCSTACSCLALDMRVCFLALLVSTVSATAPGVPFLFLELLPATSVTELSTCAAGVGCLNRLVGLDSPVRKGIVVVRLVERLLGVCDARGPELGSGWRVTFIRASPVSIRKDLEGEARGFGVVAECAMDVGATLRRV